jgi:uncharacterized membrane protein (UPF0127 family)
MATAGRPNATMDRVELRGDWGRRASRVEIADTPQTRAQGLMFVEEMPRTRRHALRFPDERMRTFWMRNTLISLDILYFDATGAWVSAQENAVPLDETTLPSDGPGAIRAGDQRGPRGAFGMGEGTVIRHPAIDPGRRGLAVRRGMTPGLALSPARDDKSAHGRGVAQPGSAPVLGTGGREFESRRPDHFTKSTQDMV